MRRSVHSILGALLQRAWDGYPVRRTHRYWLVPAERGQMAYSRPAVHRTILVVDVEGFGNRHRTNPQQVAVRDGMYRALRQTFHNAGVRWADCRHEDRGDGVLILASAQTPKASFVESLPGELAEALREHNSTHRAQEQIRLRMALHAGEINYDDHGVAGAAINLAFRLLAAGPLKAALADSPGVLALIVSSWFYDEVLWRYSQRGDVTRGRSGGKRPGDGAAILLHSGL